MKKLIDVTYLLAGLFLCILTAICLFFSARKLTYLEYRMSLDVRTVTVRVQDEELKALACADEDGKVFYEILDNITVNVEPGRPIPVAAKLCDLSGNVMCDLGVDVIADVSGSGQEDDAPGAAEDIPKADVPEYSTVLFHVSFLGRPSNPENCCVLFSDASGNPFDLSDIANYSWYGGFSDPFWKGLSVFGIVFSMIFLLRGIYNIILKKNVHKDRWIQAMFVAAVSFIVLSVLASEFNPTIMDENDNIIGGMLQAGNGNVIYRDYVSQHMPFVYWLCALFARLGAKAFGQFRLLFGLTVSLVWGLVFFRHRESRFARAIVLFTVFYGPVSYMFIGENAGQILSDNVQAVAMTVLFLEMMAYFECHGIGVDRVLIVSMCIFAAVGSAFLAVYSVFACMVAFCAEEIRFHRKNPESTSFSVGRYIPLAVCVIIPWVCAVVYLGMNGALQDAIDMAFRLNLEIYPKYGMPGKNFLEPFYSGIINIVNLVRETRISYAAGEMIAARAVESIMIIVTGILLIAAVFRRGPIQALGIFFFIETQATRQAVRFHSIMLWSVVFMFILIELPGMSAVICAEDPSLSVHPDERSGQGTGISKSRSGRFQRVFFPVMQTVYFLVLLVIFGFSYVKLAQNVVKYRVDPVPPTEMSAVNDTDPGEKVFLDAGALKTDYLLYKKRYPVTRLCWTLPWYYEWYGEETTRTLKEEKPRIVVYKMGVDVWGISGFAKETEDFIKKEYERVGPFDLYERKSS